ncbi:Alpha subunit of translation initiation factor eIF2, partial [Spraguea lophii 42_110]
YFLYYFLLSLLLLIHPISIITTSITVIITIIIIIFILYYLNFISFLSLMSDCRFYTNEYPSIGDLVVVRNARITDMGVYVQLLEYNNMEGLIIVGELSKKRIKNVRKSIKIGKMEICSILRVDEEKGFIDLSRKKPSVSDYEKKYRSYLSNKSAHNVMIGLAQSFNKDVLQLYNEFGWKKADEYGSLYNYFLELFKCYNNKSDNSNDGDKIDNGGKNDTTIDNDNKIDTKIIDSKLVKDVNPEYIPVLLEYINNKFNSSKYKIRMDIELTCAKDGINAIKDALSEAYEIENIEVKLYRLPIYSMCIVSNDIEKSTEKLIMVSNKIKNKILQYGGTYSVAMEPKVYGGKEFKEDDEDSGSEGSSE